MASVAAKLAGEHLTFTRACQVIPRGRIEKNPHDLLAGLDYTKTDDPTAGGLVRPPKGRAGWRCNLLAYSRNIL